MVDLLKLTLSLPHTPGVYILKDQAATVIYVGKARDLKERVSWYFKENSPLLEKTRQLVHYVESLEIVKTISEFDALILEATLIKKFRPKYNVVWKDDKHPLYIKITTKSEFPRIRTTRREDDTTSTYFGPFPSSRITRQVLRFLRRIFPYCTQKGEKQACFYNHLGLCDPCPAAIRKLPIDEAVKEKRRYKKNISQIIRILSGKTSTVIGYLEKKMEAYTQHEQFEQAAVMRDQINRLRFLTQVHFSANDYLTNPNLLSDIRHNQMKALMAWCHQVARAYKLGVKPPQQLHRIECFDISNLLGKEAVGSMVVFIDGEKASPFYRRFRIRTKTSPDDPAMMKEVINRRFSHKEWPYPDLLVVDGGASQVSAAVRAAKEAGIAVFILGLAKRLEEFILPLSNGSFTKNKLPSDNGGLHLLMRLRDEAHRFALSYHRLLRGKNNQIV